MGQREVQATVKVEGRLSLIGWGGGEKGGESLLSALRPPLTPTCPAVPCLSRPLALAALPSLDAPWVSLPAFVRPPAKTCQCLLHHQVEVLQHREDVQNQLRKAKENTKLGFAT